MSRNLQITQRFKVFNPIFFSLTGKARIQSKMYYLVINYFLVRAKGASDQNASELMSTGVAVTHRDRHAILPAQPKE